MAKIKKRKLRWEASVSPQVVGYKLYWETDGKVHYGSDFMAVGNVTELVLPDDVKNFKPVDGPVTFAVTAVDEVGNESDLITLDAPYQFSAPQAPKDLWLETEKDFHTSHAPEASEEQPDPIPLFDRRLQQMEEELQVEEAKVPAMVRGTKNFPRRYDNG